LARHLIIVNGVEPLMGVTDKREDKPVLEAVEEDMIMVQQEVMAEMHKLQYGCMDNE
jgi:hypothetical protein